MSAGVPALAADDGRAFVGLEDNTLHMIDLETGAQGWSVDVAGGDRISASGYAGDFVWPSLLVTAADGAAYAARRGGELHAIDAATGATKWTAAVATAAPPVVIAGLVVVSTSDGLHGLRPDDGTAEWDASIANTWPVRVGDLLVAANQTQMIGIDPESGQERWRLDLDQAMLPPVANNSTVFLLGKQLIAVDPATGQVRWHADDVTNPAAASPNDDSTSSLPGEWPVDVAATDRGVIAIRGGGTWYAIGFDAASGTCLWKQIDNGEGGFGLTTAGNDLYLQRTNCSPLRVDPTTGTATAWLDPMATPDRTGDWQNDVCHSYPEFAMFAADDTLLGAAHTDVIAAQL